MLKRSLTILALTLATISAFADGRIGAPSPAVTNWAIVGTQIYPALKQFVIRVAYIRSDNSIDHQIDVSVQDQPAVLAADKVTVVTPATTDGSALLAALGASVGTSESGCVVSGKTDVWCINNLRLSTWLVNHNLVTGSPTAVPTVQ